MSSRPSLMAETASIALKCDGDAPHQRTSRARDRRARPARCQTLRQRWREVYGQEPPPRIRAVLLRRAIAYQLQVLAFGGLKPKTIRLLRKLATELRVTRAKRLAGAI